MDGADSTQQSASGAEYSLENEHMPPPAYDPIPPCFPHPWQASAVTGQASPSITATTLNILLIKILVMCLVPAKVSTLAVRTSYGFFPVCKLRTFSGLA